MLTWSFIVERITEELGLPFQALEKTDQEIEDYCKRNALKKFSKFFPDKQRISLDTTDSDLQVPNRTGEYYIVDPDNRIILSVVEFIPTFGSKLIDGHPIIGPFTFESIPEYLLQTFKANTVGVYGNYNYVTEFIPPNTIRITPNYSGTAIVEYERTLDPELSDLNPELEDDFIELCIATVFQMIGRIRRRYGNIATPFGEITLNADEIFSEGETRYNDIMTKLNEGSLANIIIDRG